MLFIVMMMLIGFLQLMQIQTPIFLNYFQEPDKPKMDFGKIEK